MKCSFCDYSWQPRKPNPESWPRCKRRFDYKPTKYVIDTELINKAKSIERGFQRTIYIISIITPKLEEKGYKVAIIGGSAVEFYTRDWYSTGDIDLAISKDRRKDLDKILKQLGFSSMGRMWVREDLNLYIEAPGDIQDLSFERLTKVETDIGTAYVLGLEDILLDRLAAAKHWQSESDWEQALQIASIFFNEIDWDYLKQKSEQNDTLDKFNELEKEAKVYAKGQS